MEFPGQKHDTYVPGFECQAPKALSQYDLNDAVRSVDMTKQYSELLPSRLKDIFSNS